MWTFTWTSDEELPDGISIIQRDPDLRSSITIGFYPPNMVRISLTNIEAIYVNIEKVLRATGMGIGSITAYMAAIRNLLGYLIIRISGEGSLMLQVRVPDYLDVSQIALNGVPVDYLYDPLTKTFTVNLSLSESVLLIRFRTFTDDLNTVLNLMTSTVASVSFIKILLREAEEFCYRILQ